MTYIHTHTRRVFEDVYTYLSTYLCIHIAHCTLRNMKVHKSVINFIQTHTHTEILKLREKNASLTYECVCICMFMWLAKKKGGKFEFKSL